MSDNQKEFKLPKKSLAVEFWVGIFTLAGVLCFAYMALNIAGMRLTNSGYYDVRANFGNISGLKVGAPLEIAGVEIGKISDIALADSGVAAEVTLKIEDSVKLRDDDILAVRTKGIIGDKYIKVVTGGSEKLVVAGSELPEANTESAVDFEEILGKLIHSFSSSDK